MQIAKWGEKRNFLEIFLELITTFVYIKFRSSKTVYIFFKVNVNFYLQTMILFFPPYDIKTFHINCLRFQTNNSMCKIYDNFFPLPDTYRAFYKSQYF